MPCELVSGGQADEDGLTELGTRLQVVLLILDGLDGVVEFVDRIKTFQSVMTAHLTLVAMTLVKQTLSKAPPRQINDLIPESVEDVLEVLESESISSKRKVDIALRINPPEELLRDSDRRDELFDLLYEDEAYELVDKLGFDEVDDPYTKLKNARFYRSSRQEEILFEFFDEELPYVNEEESRPGLVKIDPKYGLFPYQRDVYNDVVEYLNSEDNRAFLHMPTGSGKTRVTMSLVCDVVKESDPGLVLWLAEGQELLDQAAEEFEDAWQNLGDREVEISRFYGTYEWDEIEEGFIVAGLKKLWNKEKNSAAFLPNFSSKVSLVVFDEAHSSVADTYQKMLQRLTHFNSNCGLIGLSATPGRTYANPEEDQKLSELYHRNKASIDIPDYDDPFEFLTSKGYLSDPEFKELEMNVQILTDQLMQELQGLSQGQEYPSRVLERLAKHDLRNLRITNKILELIEAGHTRIILFATTVDHARIISAILNVQDIESSVITSKTPEYYRDRNISRFKANTNRPRVLCNYSVLTTGFDAPQTSAAVIARPTTSLVLYSQMVGRAIRGPRVGGTEEAEIWTVIDTDLPGFGSLTEAFWNWEDVW